MIPTIVKRLLLNRHTFFLAGLSLYLWLADPLIEWTKGQLRMEIPLLLYLYVWLNVLVKASPWQPVVAAVPLAALYLAHDYYFLRFFRIPKLNDFVQIPELIGVLGFWGNLALFGAALALLYLMALFLRPSVKALAWALPGVIVFSAPFVWPEVYLQLFSRLSIEVIHYAAVVNVEYNGRLATALYHEAKRRDTMNHISQYRDMTKLSLTLPPALETVDAANGRNVHMIVLEGFLDPTLLTNLPEKIDPVHPELTALLGTQQGFSVSPVFGGYTSQAEFEVLCGVPAFQEFDEIEFNVFTGAETYCLPRILHRLGYQTMASNGFKPDFFNTIPAYRGIGFDEVYFSKEYTPSLETYLSKGEAKDNKYFFDGDLFDQNLAFVKRRLEEKKPFFNYVLTVYGHFPFEYGSRVGPPRFKMAGIPWDLERILNQHYYRGKALADYLKQLMALDPNALIVVVSDHLPPLEGGFGAYEKFGYLQPNLADRFHRNRFLVFRDGKLETHDIFYHFNIYRLILDYVTRQGYCQARSCDFRHPLDKETLRDDYRIIMGLASRPVAP
ncbi:MAG: LTA synthase family protein [Magnetococcales bacterium]|nr:LTA synthase family protein [Magnetococcales bacterium]